MKSWKKIISLIMVLGFMGTILYSGEKEEKTPLKERVQEEKREAWQDGKYSCCINTPCDQCIVNMGACPCGENLLAGKPVCHECVGGWIAGDGKFDNIKPEDVKPMPRGKM